LSLYSAFSPSRSKAFGVYSLILETPGGSFAVTHLRAFAYILQYLMQRLALLVFAIAALAILCATLAAAIGALP
jgi:hypothetical protein|tara:strand:+ start:4970 stop:5191 length:222 start_codon:yes stop_codon:yes gene_type:complete